MEKGSNVLFELFFVRGSLSGETPQVTRQFGHLRILKRRRGDDFQTRKKQSITYNTGI